MERLPFRVNRDPEIAKRFATAISRAPLLPLAITGAAGGILAEQVITAPTAYAQEQKDCFVNVEVYKPTAGEEMVVTDKTTLYISCSKGELIELNADEKGSIRVGASTYASPISVMGIIASSLVAGIGVGIIAARKT